MKVLKGFGVFLAVIYSIIFFVAFTVYMTLCCTSNILKKDFYSTVVNRIDLHNIKISDVNNNVSFEDKDLSAQDYFIKEMEKEGIDNKTANMILENKKIKEVLVGIIGGSIDYYLLDGEIPQIEPVDVKQIIKELDFEDELKKNNIDIDKFVSDLNTSIKESLSKSSDQENGGSIFGDKEKTDNINSIFKFINSSAFWFVLIGFIAASYLLFSLLSWSFKKPFTYMGIPVLITGIVFIITKTTLVSIIDVFFEIEIYKSILNMIATPFLYVGLICVISGVVMIVGRCLIKSHDVDKYVNNALDGQNI